MLVLPALSHAMSGMQMARDGHRVMINKDVGNERWSMMYDSDDHTVIGTSSSRCSADPTRFGTGRKELWAQWRRRSMFT